MPIFQRYKSKTRVGVETEKTEFKKTTGELREGITSLASMLNKNGYGVLYFGVKDNGDIVGQQMGNRTLIEISQAIANFLKPQVIPTIEHKLIDDKNVIKITHHLTQPHQKTMGHEAKHITQAHQHPILHTIYSSKTIVLFPGHQGSTKSLRQSSPIFPVPAE